MTGLAAASYDEAMETEPQAPVAARRLAPAAFARRARGRDFSPVDVYRRQFAGQPRRERMFIGSLGFFAGFGAARAVTHAIRARVGPFHNLSVGGRHLHHMVFG